MSNLLGKTGIVHSRELVLSLYRSMLSIAKHSSPPCPSTKEIQTAFRHNYKLSTDSAITTTLLQTATSKLAFMHSVTPARLWRNARERKRQLIRDQLTSSSKNFGDVESGQHTYRFDSFGEPIFENPTRFSARISNSQGLTDEQYKRHYALMDRFNFGGEFWKNKK